MLRERTAQNLTTMLNATHRLDRQALVSGARLSLGGRPGRCAQAPARRAPKRGAQAPGPAGVTDPAIYILGPAAQDRGGRCRAYPTGSSTVNVVRPEALSAKMRPP